MDIFSQTAHRPYPVPKGPWVGRQNWNCVLFAHWRIASEVLQYKLPHELIVDTFDGDAWISIVALQVSRNRLRGLPPLPLFSSYAQLNLRTYVTCQGKPGIYTFSMDASHPFINRAARYLGHLTYLDADISIKQHNKAIEYISHRTQPKEQPAEFNGTCEPTSAVFHSKRGSLTYWLTERYCLYTVTGDGKVLQYQIHHPAWPLQEAKLQLYSNTLAEPQGFAPREQDPLVYYAQKQPVVLWPPYRVQ